MARLAVFAAVVTPVEDEKVETSRYKRGDTVEVVEDGVFLGRDVEGPTATGTFRVVEVLGAPAADFAYLLARDPGNTTEPFKTDLGWSTHKRTLSVDLDSLESFTEGKLGHKPTAADAVVLDKDTELDTELTAKVATKPEVPRSGVIG